MTDRIDSQIVLNAVGATGGTVSILTGTGTPEGAVAASAGSIFLRTDGAAATTLYVKTGVATATTLWTAK